MNIKDVYKTGKIALATGLLGAGIASASAYKFADNITTPTQIERPARPSLDDFVYVSDFQDSKAQYREELQEYRAKKGPSGALYAFTGIAGAVTTALSAMSVMAKYEKSSDPYQQTRGNYK